MMKRKNRKKLKRPVKVEIEQTLIIEHERNDSAEEDDLPSICISCLKRNGVKDIFKTYYNMNKPEVYAEMLSYTFAAKVLKSEDKDVGHYMCENCIRNLRTAMAFRRQLEVSQYLYTQMHDELLLLFVDPGNNVGVSVTKGNTTARLYLPPNVKGNNPSSVTQFSFLNDSALSPQVEVDVLSPEIKLEEENVVAIGEESKKNVEIVLQDPVADAEDDVMFIDKDDPSDEDSDAYWNEEYERKDLFGNWLHPYDSNLMQCCTCKMILPSHTWKCPDRPPDKCQFCEVVFTDVKSFRQHQLIHRKSIYPCLFTPNRFYHSVRELKAHMRKYCRNVPQQYIADINAKHEIASIPVFSMPLLQHLDISTNLLTTLGLAPGTHLPRGLKTVRLHRNPWQCACLDQVLAVLVRRRVSFQATPFFQGRAPVCVVPDAKANRCAGASTASKAQLEKTYQTALKKYPQTINRI